MWKSLLAGAIKLALKDPEIRQWLEDQRDKTIQLAKSELLPPLIAAFPGLATVVVKYVFDRLPGMNMPGTVNEITKGAIESIVEGDPDIPGVSDMIEKATGIDVSEMLRKMLGL